MLLPSEIEAKITIPLLRALVVKKLVSEHGYTQERAAKALGITQAAVSNYLRGVRGSLASLENKEEVAKITEEITNLIIDGYGTLAINKRLQEGVCLLRKTRALCDVHKQLEPEIDIDECHICDV